MEVVVTRDLLSQSGPTAIQQRAETPTERVLAYLSTVKLFGRVPRSGSVSSSGSSQPLIYFVLLGHAHPAWL